MSPAPEIHIGSITSSAQKEEWNTFAERSSVGHMQQCSWWADPLISLGVTTHILGCWRERTLVGGALFRSIPVPFLRMSITECLSGPIFTEWRAEWADLLVRRIQGLACDVNAVKVEIQGCPSKEVHEDLLRAFDRQDAKVEIHAGVSEAVLVLEGRTKEDLWNNFKTLTKRSLKKGMAGPIHVRRLTGLADLQHAYESWMATSRRQKFSRIRAWPVIEPVLRHSVERGIGEVLASYHDSQLLASIFVGHIGNRSSYVYGGYVDGAESYRPTHILQYMAIQEAIDRRMSSYTFGELNEEPFRTGVDQFKLGFGAIPIRNLDTIVWPRKPLCHGIIQGVRSMDIGQALEKLLMKYKGAFAKT